MKLIVGLGNPGKEYSNTRHNIGWNIVSALAQKIDASFREKTGFQSEIAEIIVDGKKNFLSHPLTFMNHSGNAVASIKNYHKINTRDILIVQDEMDFAVGDFAFTKKHGPAGHNGIISIQQSLKTDEIARLRIGIGRQTKDNKKKEDYVLQKFSNKESKIIQNKTPVILDAVIDWIKLGITKSMNNWNART